MSEAKPKKKRLTMAVIRKRSTKRNATIGERQVNTADAIVRTLESPNVCDTKGDAANIVDVVYQLSQNANRIARAIGGNGAAGKDATGGSVDCVVEAGMGITAALVQIAEAIDGLAEAVRNHSHAARKK